MTDTASCAARLPGTFPRKRHFYVDALPCVTYKGHMDTKQTPEFAKWLKGLKDRKAYRAITIRIARVEAGLLGNARSVGGQVSELKVDVGPGYRVYFTIRGQQIVILLCGGTKGSQERDIEKAKELAASLE